MHFQFVIYVIKQQTPVQSMQAAQEDHLAPFFHIVRV